MPPTYSCSYPKFPLNFLLLFSPSKQFTINRSLPCGYRLKSLVTNLKTMEPLPDQNNLFKIFIEFHMVFHGYRAATIIPWSITPAEIVWETMDWTYG